MIIDDSFENIKMHTEKLLAIKQFKTQKDKLNYQNKLNKLRSQLVGVSREVQLLAGYSDIYFIEDLQNTIERMEVYQLIRDVETRLNILSHTYRN